VFLPTAFALILFPEPGEFITPMATVKELLDSADEIDDDKNLDLIAAMRNHDAELHSIWDLDEDEIWRSLHHFSQRFNEIWGKSTDLFFYFNIFSTPMEIGEYLIEEYEKEEMLDYFEDESGMTKEEWMDTCEGVYENDFMRLKFMDILNNRVEDILE
jgi:hypothetical protein